MRILGASGQGKSVFLETMLQQAAQKRIMTVIVHLQGKLPEIDGAQVINIAEQFPDGFYRKSKYYEPVCKLFQAVATTIGYICYFNRANAY